MREPQNGTIPSLYDTSLYSIDSRLISFSSQHEILKALVSETSKDGSPPPFKYAVNSTIIQHLSDPRPQPSNYSTASTQGSEGSTTENEKSADVSNGITPPAQKVGRRGMHSATGAFWNNEKDGMWSYKYDGAPKLGMDVVVCVMWIAL
ncbi:MAG: hypothetical protein M1820_007748 [Bogoriella megaspora]|nr:MAG: hypothetical protein M1820_007748 [Bogoriella megaspora]